MVPERVRRLEPYKTETSKARVKLSSNELPFSIPEPLRERIKEEVSKIPIERYPDPQAKDLKEVVADFFGVSEENLILGNGSDELIYYLSSIFGDGGIYIPVPTFPIYSLSAEALGKRKVEVLLDEEFDVDLEASLKAVKNEGCTLAYYSYPNNPTGNLFSRDRIRKIREIGTVTVIDEAYYSFSGETFLEEALSREDTFVLRSLSKIGMAGLRIGVLIGREEVVKEIDKVRLPFNVTYPSRAIARVMLTEGREFIEDSVRKVVRERERLKKEMESMEEVEVFPSYANFILFRTPHPAKLVHSKLLERGVLVRDVSYMPKLERCLRVSVGTPEENDEFLEALCGVLRELS